MYKGVDKSVNILNSDSITYTGVNQQYNNYIIGWSSLATSIISCKKLGDIGLINFYYVGTSNSTSVIIPIPYGLNFFNAVYPPTNVFKWQVRGQDNGGAFAAKIAYLSPSVANQATIQIYNSPTATTAWTASGTKAVSGQIFLPLSI